jgi:hypothetical protein
LNATEEQSIVHLRPEVDKASQLLDSYQQLLEQVLAKAEQKRTGLTVGTVKIDETGKGIIGVQNPDGTEGTLDVKIGDVSVGKGAKGVVGFSKGVVKELGTNFWD